MAVRTKEQTRQLILSTGRDLLREHGSPAAICVKLSDVLERLELTTGAAYHIWKNQDAFRLELAQFCATSLELPVAEDFIALVEKIPADTNFDEAVGVLSKATFDLFVNSPDAYTRLYFWTVREPDDSVVAPIIETYRSSDGLSSGFRWLLERYERRVMPPLTLDDLIVLALGMLDGLALRFRIDPSAVAGTSQDLFGVAMTGLCKTHTAAL